MNGGSVAGQSFILTDPNWRVQDIADFNGDGKADLLWYAPPRPARLPSG